MSEPLAVVDNVSYQYPHAERFALTNLSLTLGRGEFVGLIGPTGAGKTTLCLAFNGIVPQFYGGRFFGYVRVAGLDTLDSPVSTLARHVGQVLQDPEIQLIATSVENEVAFALENIGLPRAQMRERIAWALDAVRLGGAERRHPSELSGGQKQRLAIAAGLAMRPDLLVLDEPTAQLDPVGAQEVFATVHELNRELGIAILIASHAAEELAEYADRLVLLAEGRIVTQGTTDEVYSQVDLLRRHHLRPPQVATTFYLIGAGRPNGRANRRIPVRLDDGLRAFEQLNGSLCPQPPDLPPHAPYGGQPLLSVKDLHHTYPDGTQALKGVSLDIHPGEYVLIAGQNGAGKSTLVRHFLHLLEPTAGGVRVGGEDATAQPTSTLARRVGYVAQNPDSQLFSRTVGEEVAFALHHLGYAEDEVERRVVENLGALGLLPERERHPFALPKGDRARVVIAAILALEPEVVIFDEPTTGQDYQGARHILEISRRLHQMGKTIVVITHHLYLMPGYAERVIVMGRGTILLDAPIRQAFHDLETLGATYLTPPQAVILAQALARHSPGASLDAYPLLTPEEVAACVVGEGG
jgi:energy-coupling factor transporter ATP-binding protein EcfA2